MTANEVLDTYLDFLDTSDTVTDKNVQDPLPTPRIDTVLESYKQKTLAPERGRDEKQDLVDYECRLAQLEKQLTALLHKTKASPPRGRGQRSTTNLTRSSSESSLEQQHPLETLTSSSPSRPSNSQSSKVGTVKSKPKTSRASRTSATDSSLSVGRQQKCSGSVIRNNHGFNQVGSSPHSHAHVTTPTEDQRTKASLLKDSVPRTSVKVKPKNGSLIEDLDKERERRWKAEQAAESLVGHVRALQMKLGDAQAKHELCVVKNSQLNTELGETRGTVQSLKSQLEEVKGQLDSCRCEIDKLQASEQEQKSLLQTLEERCRTLERERVQERTEMVSRVQQAEKGAAGTQREAELLTRSVRHLKTQLHQTQELLADREQEHWRQLEHCKPMDNKELQELVSRELTAERAKMEAQIDQHKEKVAEQQKAYSCLEDEFRMALRIETGRFQELHRTYEQVSAEVESSRETAIAAVQKEQKAHGVIVELTALVKEQKGRIAELSRSKEEVLSQLKECLRAIEDESSTKHKLEAKLHSLQEENGRLLAKVQAQESVIEGLREERQLWGKELAHQGATLAQDRGRMEAQLEGLTEEVKTTREQLQRERQALRIKEKQVEDQLHSIHELKQSLSSKEHEVQSLQLDWQREQQSLQLQLEQEQAENHDLQEQVSGLVERKETLKEEVASSQESVEQWKIKYSKLKTQWDEKVSILGTLEENMGKLQETFSQREVTLVQEKEHALEEARMCQQRLKSCDDAFREQLEAKQRSHDHHMTKLLAEKDRELQQAQQRVASVEDEMRQLLTDVAREKKNMEAKFQKLLKAFQEVRLDSSD